MANTSPDNFLQSHFGSLSDATSKRLTEQLATLALSEEWYAFQSVLPLDGVSVDNETAASMANKFGDLANLILENRWSGFRYVVARDSKVVESIPAPDGVMHHFRAVSTPNADPNADPAGELYWGKVYVLFDFSPHVRVDSSVKKKHMAWAQLVRAQARSPRDLVLGVAFDANRFHLWVVKQDGAFISSSTVNLPRVPGRLQGPLGPMDKEESEALLQLLRVLSTIALAERFLIPFTSLENVENVPEVSVPNASGR